MTINPVKKKRGPKPKGGQSRDANKGVVEYGLHLGNSIRGVLEEKNMLQTLLYQQLNISSNALQNKLNNPYYGTIYDIIKTSKYLNLDLFDFIRKFLSEQGETLFNSEQEKAIYKAKDQENEILLLRKQVEMLKEVIQLEQKISTTRQ